MNIEQKIIKLLKKGNTVAEVARILKLATSTVSGVRNQYYLPNHRLINILLKNPSFKITFNNYYNKHTNDECFNYIKNHRFFKKLTLNKHIVTSLRVFYNIPHKKYENTYYSDLDRTKGYMIRNSKYSSKKRGIIFNLKYSDIEIPEYCPLLNIKLTFRLQSDFNEFSHATLDRIDNNKGYIKGNIMVISRLANQMKNCASFEQLEIFSKNITKITKYFKNQDALGSITDIFPNIKLKT